MNGGGDHVHALVHAFQANHLRAVDLAFRREEQFEGHGRGIGVVTGMIGRVNDGVLEWQAEVGQLLAVQSGAAHGQVKHLDDRGALHAVIG